MPSAKVAAKTNTIFTRLLHYMYYNFCHIHKTLLSTPAMRAGVTKRLWEISDIVDLLYSEYAKKA